MMIIDGPDQTMRAALLAKLMEAAKQYDEELRFFTAGDGVRCDLRYLLAFIHIDHRLLVRDGWPSTGDPVEDQMLGYGLTSGGTIVAWCGEAPEAELLLPCYWCEPGRDLDELVYALLDWWRHQRLLWTQFFAYGSVGRVLDHPIMLVGESYNPFVPADHRRGLAFTAQGGASRFLHDAIARNHGERYYITNALKFDKPKRDLAALKLEIAAIEPSLIVAMGNIAAALLAKTGHPFRITCHPQFWHRFRNGREAELAQDISFTKTTV